MSDENEFIDWHGGECPVATDMLVQVLLQGRPEATAPKKAGSFNWQRVNYNGDIIAYRVVKAEKPDVKIPEGFTPWSGGSTPLPGEHYLRVELLLSNGDRLKGAVFEFDWAHTGSDSDIIAYRLVEAEEKPKVARDTQVAGTHYKTATVQPWDVVDTWPIEQQIGFYRGNALKYIMRMGTKDDDLTEIRKADHYLQKLVEVLEQKGGV